MKIRFPKSKVTDFRPPGAGKPSPLEGRKARPGAAAWPKSNAAADRERAGHDISVRGLSDDTLIAAAKDLGKRRCYDQRDPEHRWTTGRLAALAREIDRRKLNRQTA